MSSLDSVNPIDGRYSKITAPLSAYFSEASLIKYRVIIESEYLIGLSQEKGVGLRQLTSKEKKLLRDLHNTDVRRVKKIESETNHDVKAVEYFLKEKLRETSLKDVTEWTHFALTSEDINNLAYALIITESLRGIILPALTDIVREVEHLSVSYKSLPMLARTHGQSASPTTLGKEFKVFSERLRGQLKQLKNIRIKAKLNGATGNFNAHSIAFPKVNWVRFSERFIKNLAKQRKVQLKANVATTQIEPHDTYAELFDLMKRINIILLDFNQDIWRYISDGWIVQKTQTKEVGSSTMPHKVNPIDFENSEGNLGIANALLVHFSSKLPISRLQRDLSDSTVERNFGTAFAHSLVAYKSLLKGLSKISADQSKIKKDLEDHPEVVAEAIQTILKREGVEAPYEKLKALYRGRKVSKEEVEKFISILSVSDKVKEELKSITPQNYTGLASSLTTRKSK
jgi:adenylosuccinate lyase